MGRIKCYAIALIQLCLMLLVDFSLTQNCGQRKAVNFLIVNGTDAKDGHWPWHAAIFRKHSDSFAYACGGTILNQHIVLTAANCLSIASEIVTPNRLVVQVGRNRLHVASNRAQEHKVLQVIVHPEYKQDSVQHDIALIKLATDITYTDYIQPICLWNRGDDLNSIIGSYGTVVGFGVDETDNLSDTLREARIPVVSILTCIRSDPTVFGSNLTPEMFCAGNRDGVGPCNGDGGEGLFFNYDGTWFIRGLVSFTIPRDNRSLCNTTQYTAFTDVAKYLTWIDQTNQQVVVPKLKPRCGQRKAMNFLIVNGTDAKDGNWPWHAAIFRKYSDSFDYVCGGTILNQHIVLTAANCLSIEYENDTPNRLVVQVGRNRLHVASNRAQEHKVLQVIVHPEYKQDSLQHDIALIKLATDITYTDYIQPICLWNRGDDQNAIIGSYGTVVGFGVDETDSPTDTLREARIPVVSTLACIRSNPTLFGSTLTPEMFCAGNRDGVGPCNGDGGEGLFFHYDGSWFIRGLVSFTFPSDITRLGKRTQYTAFTDVAKYLTWIDQTNELKVIKNLKPSCGKRKVANFLVVNGTDAKEGYWPWHAALFHKTRHHSFDYACGGTILDPNTVLTAAHCLTTSNGIITRERLVVQVGRYRLRLTSNRAQEHKPSELIVHPKYNINRIQHDIALIKLTTKITFTDYVQPICLWNRGEDLNSIIGSWGTVVGFGKDENDNLPDTLREARVPVVSSITCIESNRELFGNQLTSSMLCAGNRDGIGPCNGDSGGGLVFNYDDTWFIRGLVSFTQPRQTPDMCDSYEYTAYTDVAKYLTWIEQPDGLGSGTQNCGTRNDGYWPWYVTILNNTGQSFFYTCGGTILDQNTVLTAAHCLMTTVGIIERKRLIVQVGRNEVHLTNNRVQEYEAFKLIVHPEYNANSNQHDIALIKLATDITFTSYIQPICLWNRGEDLNSIIGSRGTVVRYGKDESNIPTDTLHEAHITIVSSRACVESNPAALGSNLTPEMICAENRDGIRASDNESGGGLFFNYDGTWFIRGLMSFSKIGQDAHTGGTKQYTVFTDVAKYLTWIGQQLRGAGSQQTVMVDYENDPKIGLLPMFNCGDNPFEDREELSKPVLHGYPWMGFLEHTISVSDEVLPICHMILISDRYLISTAYCASRIQSNFKSSVRLGVYNSNTTDCAQADGQMVCSPPVQSIRIESVIKHPGYDNSRKVNNIALIRLRERADTSRINVKPICLPVTNQLRSQKSTHYTLTGWSSSRGSYMFERSLREFVDLIECQKLYNLHMYNITSGQMCIKQRYGPACTLPLSGAALQLVQQVQGKGRYVLYGLLSYGPRLCSDLRPDVYTNVASYVDWILENIQE